MSLGGEFSTGTMGNFQPELTLGLRSSSDPSAACSQAQAALLSAGLNVTGRLRCFRAAGPCIVGRQHSVSSSVPRKGESGDSRGKAKRA